MNNKKCIYLYTDGAITNGGNKDGSGRAVGGIGIVLSTDANDYDSIFDRISYAYAGPTHGKMEKTITNNRMELKAVCKSLEYLIDNFEDLQEWIVVVRSDSQYVIKSINEYLPNWEKNNWKNSSRQTVKNRDLWERFTIIRDKFKNNKIDLNFKHEKGHAGHPIQELSDTLATQAVKSNMHLK